MLLSYEIIEGEIRFYPAHHSSNPLKPGRNKTGCHYSANIYSYKHSAPEPNCDCGYLVFRTPKAAAASMGSGRNTDNSNLAIARVGFDDFIPNDANSIRTADIDILEVDYGKTVPTESTDFPILALGDAVFPGVEAEPNRIARLYRVKNLGGYAFFISLFFISVMPILLYYIEVEPAIAALVSILWVFLICAVAGCIHKVYYSAIRHKKKRVRDNWYRERQDNPPRDAVPAARGSNSFRGRILGYRTWNIYSEKDELALQPLTNDINWKPGLNLAVCPICESSPGENCHCGFNALNTLKGALLYARETNWAVSMVGAVAGSGDIRLHMNGWRAERAEIIGLFVARPNLTGYGGYNDFVYADGLRLARIYGVPAFHTKQALQDYAETQASKSRPEFFG